VTEWPLNGHLNAIYFLLKPYRILGARTWGFGRGSKLTRMTATLTMTGGKVAKCPRPCVIRVWLSNNACHFCLKPTHKKRYSQGEKQVSLEGQADVPGDPFSSLARAAIPAQTAYQTTRPNVGRPHSPRAVIQSQHQPRRFNWRESKGSPGNERELSSGAP
jgi:hypothetical protein